MRFVAAILYAVAAAVLLGCGLAFAFHGLAAPTAALALAGGAALGVVACCRDRRAFAWPTMDVWDGAALTVFALFALRAFLWLVFRDRDEIDVLSPNNLGDLSLHITYVRHFAAGAPFWPENPIFAGAPLTYPVGMDLFNALLACVGVDVLRGFIWVGLIASACTAAALWKWGRSFAVAGFLFAGGLFGFEFFRRWELLDYQSDAAWAGTIEVAWKSLPLALFVTQRGLLYALPAGLLLLTSWRARWLWRGRPVRDCPPGAPPGDSGSEGVPRTVAVEGDRATPPPDLSHPLPRWGEALLYAAMPIFHLHTFLFLSIIAAVWFVALPAARRHFGLVVGAAFIPASWQVWQITGHFHGASILGWKPGWMQGDQNFFAFWLLNFGLLPMLVGALVFTIVQRRRRSAALLVFPALAVFLLCCFVKFAPWEWDNTKLMLWSYLVILPPLWSELLARWPEWARLVSCAGLFFSGGISLFGGISGAHTGYPIAKRSELDGVAAALRGIPIAERFIAAPAYNHPLLLNGRIVAMGYSGHVWSHGLDWRPRLADVERVLEGKDGWRETAQRLGVRYVFWGREEDEHYAGSPQPWRDTARVVAAGEWGALYDLTLPPAR